MRRYQLAQDEAGSVTVHFVPSGSGDERTGDRIAERLRELDSELAASTVAALEIPQGASGTFCVARSSVRPPSA